MNIARSAARWTCTFFIGVTLGTWIFLITLQTTILDRTVVKNWLVQSGIYDKGLNIQLHIAPDSQGDTSLITSDVLQQAFAQTFDAAYLQKNVGTVVDRTYDWLESKANTISFSIPVQEKADAFSKNMAALIEPKLAALPVCATRLGSTDVNHLTCLPQGIKAGDYAAQLTKPSSDNNFLGAPLTEQTLKSGFPQLYWLPPVVQWVHLLVIALPFITLIFGGLYVWASPDKLRGVSRVGRQLTINSAITVVGGLLVWFASTSVDLSSAVEGGDAQQAVTTFVNPLARTILPDIGRALTLYGGVVLVIGAALWIGMFIVRRKLTPKLPLRTHVPPTAEPEAMELPKPEVPKKPL